MYCSPLMQGIDVFKRKVLTTPLRDVPWREAHAIGIAPNPYYTLVAEIMLQQTQVERVAPKYTAFITRFPTTEILAAASLHDVLTAWQGLGYNRRAIMLQRCAQTVTSLDSFPHDEKALQQLPGIGPYTAAAVAAFAFDQPTIVIETNIRTALIHAFFQDKESVTDKELAPLLAELITNVPSPCEWYNKLMDYGAIIKREHGNLSRKSVMYAKQSSFKGSDREIRGAVLREVLTQPYGRKILYKKLLPLCKDTARISKVIDGMVKEGIIVDDGKVHVSRKS